MKLSVAILVHLYFIFPKRKRCVLLNSVGCFSSTVLFRLCDKQGSSKSFVITGLLLEHYHATRLQIQKTTVTLTDRFQGLVCSAVLTAWTMSLLCAKCGTENHRDANYCNHCGDRLGSIGGSKHYCYMSVLPCNQPALSYREWSQKGNAANQPPLLPSYSDFRRKEILYFFFKKNVT